MAETKKPRGGGSEQPATKPPSLRWEASESELGRTMKLDASPPRNIVVYTTLCKLLDHIAEVQTEPPRPVWPPEEAGLLIVDDVGAQTGSPTPLLTAERFKTLLEGVLTRNPYLQAVAQQKRVIWVVGDDPKLSKDWMSALTEALAGCRVVDVVLPDPIPPEARRRRPLRPGGPPRPGRSARRSPGCSRRAAGRWPTAGRGRR